MDSTVIMHSDKYLNDHIFPPHDTLNFKNEPQRKHRFSELGTRFWILVRDLSPPSRGRDRFLPPEASNKYRE